MNEAESMSGLRSRANEISQIVTAMHSLVGGLSDAGAKNEILRALFELTKQVEVVKKHLLRLEKRDDSTVL